MRGWDSWIKASSNVLSQEAQVMVQKSGGGWMKRENEGLVRLEA